MELECILETDLTGLDDELMNWMWVIISKYMDRSCVSVCMHVCVFEQLDVFCCYLIRLGD